MYLENQLIPINPVIIMSQSMVEPQGSDMIQESACVDRVY